MIQATISRAGLSLPDLVLSDTPGGTFVLSEEGQAEPEVSWRYTYAPASSDMHGSTLLQAVKQHSTLPLSVYVNGTSAADLQANRQALVDAVEQFAYTVQLLVDGQGLTWSCDATSPQWSPLDSGMARAFMARATLVIPVYPIGA